MKSILCIFLLLVGATALAQGQRDYQLNEGRVQFSAPGTWSAILQKTDGNPQAIAFHVPDPAAVGSDAAADVTLKTRRVANPAQYSSLVRQELDRARGQPDYREEQAGGEDAAHRYTLSRAGVRYHVEDSYRLRGDLMIELRCQRPILARSSAAWDQDFDAACARLAATLGT